MRGEVNKRKCLDPPITADSGWAVFEEEGGEVVGEREVESVKRYPKISGHSRAMPARVQKETTLEFFVVAYTLKAGQPKERVESEGKV